MRHGHEHGAYLGGLRNIRTLRERCFIGDDGCWHLRQANGRAMPRDKRHAVWVFGRGVMTSTRAAWLFATGSLPADGHIVFRTCESYDCVKPNHLQSGPKTAQGKMLAERGSLRGSMSRVQANRANGMRRRKLTLELAQWARESEQPATDIAHALGIAVSRAIDVKAGRCWQGTVIGASVFHQVGVA